MKNSLIEEEYILGLILYGGNARSLAMQAIDEASEGQYEQADRNMQEAHEALEQAHLYQSYLLKKELDEQLEPSSLLLIHGQDHLMSAISVIDLAERFIHLYNRLDERSNK